MRAIHHIRAPSLLVEDPQMPPLTKTTWHTSVLCAEAIRMYSMLYPFGRSQLVVGRNCRGSLLGNHKSDPTRHDIDLYRALRRRSAIYPLKLKSTPNVALLVDVHVHYAVDAQRWSAPSFHRRVDRLKKTNQDQFRCKRMNLVQNTNLAIKYAVDKSACTHMVS